MREYLNCFLWTWFGTPYSVLLWMLFILPYIGSLFNDGWFWYCVFGLAVTVPGIPMTVYFEKRRKA